MQHRSVCHAAPGPACPVTLLRTLKSSSGSPPIHLVGSTEGMLAPWPMLARARRYAAGFRARRRSPQPGSSVTLADNRIAAAASAGVQLVEHQVVQAFSPPPRGRGGGGRAVGTVHTHRRAVMASFSGLGSLSECLCICVGETVVVRSLRYLVQVPRPPPGTTKNVDDPWQRNSQLRISILAAESQQDLERGREVSIPSSDN